MHASHSDVVGTGLVGVVKAKLDEAWLESRGGCGGRERLAVSEERGPQGEVEVHRVTGSPLFLSAKK